MTDEAIWVKHRDELIRYAAVLVGPDEAEDVLSTVVLRVLRKRSLADLDDARSYLFKAVLNEARTLRRRLARVRLPAAGVYVPVDVSPEVLGAVKSLPGRQQAAIYLVYWRDLSLAETASLMGCRPGTVKRYLHLARSRLQGVLDDR